MFGDDAAYQESVKAAKNAAKEQRAIEERIASIRGAVKRRELAGEHGVNVTAKAEKELADLEAEKARWQKWADYPDLRDKAYGKMKPEAKPGSEAYAKVMAYLNAQHA